MSDRETYYQQARSWADDARHDAARSRRIAWTVAGIAVAAAAFEAVALAMLVPLKTVQPVTLLVDRQTGFVQALDPLTPKRVSADAALTDAFLAQYVMGREGYDRATIGIEYRRVALWSSGSARARYLSSLAAANPESPMRLYANGTVVTVLVKSVSRLSPGTSLVRFDTQRVDRNGSTEPARPWISLVRYRFSDAAMAFSDRLVNPLGFQVIGYRRDAEAPVPALAAPAIVGAQISAVQSDMPPVQTTPSRRMPAPARTARIASPAATSPYEASQSALPSNQVPMGSPLGQYSAALPGQS